MFSKGYTVTIKRTDTGNYLIRGLFPSQMSVQVTGMDSGDNDNYFYIVRKSKTEIHIVSRDSDGGEDDAGFSVAIFS